MGGAERGRRANTDQRMACTRRQRHRRFRHVRYAASTPPSRNDISPLSARAASFDLPAISPGAASSRR